MNRLKQVDLIYMKRSRYKLNIAIGIIVVLLALAFGCSFGVYYKQYNQLFRIYTDLYTKHTTSSKGATCESAEPYPTYRIITKIPKQMLSQNQMPVNHQMLASNTTSSNTLLQRLQAEEQVDEEQEEQPEYLEQPAEQVEQEFEYFTKILQIKPILKDLVLENLHTDTNYSNYYQQLFTKYGQMTSIEQIDSSKIEPEEIDDILMITSAGSLEYTNFTNYHEQEEQLLENLEAVGLKPNSKIDIPKDVQLQRQNGCGIPYSLTQQSILIDGDVHLPIHIKGDVKTGDKINAVYTDNYKGDIIVEGNAGNITVSEGVAGNILVQNGSVAGNILVQEGGVDGNITVQKSVSGNIAIQESVSGNISISKGVAGNITVSETGVGGKIHITGNVGENITATDDTTDDSVIYIKGNIKGYKKGIYVDGGIKVDGIGIQVSKDIDAQHGAIHVVGDLLSEEGNVIEIGGIFANTDDPTQKANAFVVHNTIEVSDNGIAILNNGSKENAFIFGQRTINLTNNQYSSLSNYSTEKNDAYKFIDYKPRGFFVNGSLIGCNNNSQFSGLAIHIRGDLKAPYGAVFNKSFEGASTNGATALSIGGQLKGYWNSLSTKSIILIEEEAGVEECLQDEACVQELYYQRIRQICSNIEIAYNLSITEEECANLHNINTGVVQILGGIRTVAGNGVYVNGDINCKGSNGKGITVSGKVIGSTYGVSVGDVQVDGGKGVSIKSITSTDRALHVNGDISSSKEGVYIKGDITANKNVLYVDGNINGISNQALFVSGDITLNNSFESTNKVVWIKGNVGTKEPDSIVTGAGIALQVDGDIQCGDSAVIVNGGVKAFGFRGDQPENKPNYGIKVKYVDVSSNSTGVVQGPYGIHVGWINSFNTSINITNEDHTQTKNITNENGVEEEQTITLPAIQTNYTAINIGGDIEGYGRHIKLTVQQENELSQQTFDTDEYKQTLNAIKESFEYILVSIDGDIKADINTYNHINYTTTYENGSNTTKYEPIYHTPKILLSTKGLYSNMNHSRTDGIQINGDIKAANGITVVGNITSSLTTNGGLTFNDSFADTVKAYVKIKGSLYQNDILKQGPNGIVVGGVIRAKNSNGFYIANSNKEVDGKNTIEAGQCISVNGGDLVASTVSSSSSSQHVIQVWSGDIIVEESIPLEEEQAETQASEGEESQEQAQQPQEAITKTHIIPAGTYTTQQILDELIKFNTAIGLNINGSVENLRKGIGVRLVGDVIAQSNAVYISGTVKTDYPSAKLDKGVSYSAIYAGNIKSNWNGITVGNIEAEKIGIAVKGTVKQTGIHERCYYDCLENDTNPDASNLNKNNCAQCRNETNYKNTIDDIPAAISVQNVESTGIGYGIHVFEYVKTNNDSIKVSGLKQFVCNTSDKLNTSICSNVNGININGTIETLSPTSNAVNINGSLNKIQKLETTEEDGVVYLKQTYNVTNNAIKGNVGLSINGTINSSNIGIELKNGMNGLQTVWKKKLDDGKANTYQTLNDTSVLSSILIQSQNQGMNLSGEINTLNEGIVLNPSNTTSITNTYTDGVLDDNQTITYGTNQKTITSGLTAIQINGDINTTDAATTVNISGTVYNDYYLEYYQRCVDENEVNTTSTKGDDGKENITAVYIKKIDTIENKVYHYSKSEIDGTGNQGRWCYNISKGAYGLMVDEIQSINTSVMLANNITSIGYKSNAIYINNGTYLYGRHGALQIGSCSTLRSDDWDPLSMVYVSFINNNLTNGQWSVYMDGIYTNNGERVTTISKEIYNAQGICADNPV